MMKSKLLFLLLLVAMSAGCTSSNRSDTSVLTGQLDSVRNGALLMRVSKLNLMGTEFTDTVFLNDKGEFTYTLQDGNYRDVMVTNLPSAGKKAFEEQKEHFQVIMLPGETVNVSGTLGKPELSGRGFYADKARANEFLKEIDAELARGRAAIMDEMKNEEDNGARSERLNAYFAEWRKKHDAAALEFIRANPGCNYSYYMTASLTEPYRSEAMQLLTPEVKEGPVKTFDEAITAILKASGERKLALEEARKKVAPGMVAPDFTLTDINGKSLALSSLRGKYVVLDFWGSWCTWCIKGIPQMKEYYKKYTGRFEILGIACGDSEAEWKKAVQTNVLPWMNVLNDEEGENDASKMYAVSGYPTKIIIGPDGKIIRYITGESQEFYTVLDGLFSR